ncbi:MAG TPA: rod shape-determining protein MreD [Planctomycetota bacterium]|nr:rod shape-determining protein MreD [Planctomycetota bacterium]
MIRFLVLLLILAAAVVIQTTVADLASIGPARPDVVVALVVYLALTYELREVFVPIWGLGILRDAFSAAPMGLHGLVFLVIALLISYVRGYVPREKPPALVIVSAAAVMLSEASVAFVLAVKHATPTPSHILVGGLLSGIYTSAIVSILPRFLHRPCRWIGLGKMQM